MRLRVLTMAAVGALAACATPAGDTPAVDSATAATPASNAAATPVVFTITAKDFSYDAPDTITSGMVTLRLVNQGPQLHHVQLVRLDAGKTYADLVAAFKTMKPDSPPPPWVHDVAGPNTPVPGGGEQSITEDLAAGNYALLCFIPGADHVPHVMKGMMKSLTVVPATGAAAAGPDGRYDGEDGRLRVGVLAGDHRGQARHQARERCGAVARDVHRALAPGKTAKDLAKWVGEQKGPPPGTPIGGISGMSKGDVAYLPVDLEPGEYGLFCFLPDAKDGSMHVEHGMIKQITVK